MNPSLFLKLKMQIFNGLIAILRIDILKKCPTKKSIIIFLPYDRDHTGIFEKYRHRVILGKCLLYTNLFELTFEVNFFGQIFSKKSHNEIYNLKFPAMIWIISPRSTGANLFQLTLRSRAQWTANSSSSANKRSIINLSSKMNFKVK